MATTSNGPSSGTNTMRLVPQPAISLCHNFGPFLAGLQYVSSFYLYFPVLLEERRDDNHRLGQRDSCETTSKTQVVSLSAGASGYLNFSQPCMAVLIVKEVVLAVVVVVVVHKPRKIEILEIIRLILILSGRFWWCCCCCRCC